MQGGKVLETLLILLPGYTCDVAGLGLVQGHCRLRWRCARFVLFGAWKDADFNMFFSAFSLSKAASVPSSVAPGSTSPGGVLVV